MNLNAISLMYLIALADTFGGLVQGVFPATLLLRTIMIAFLLVYVFKLSGKRSGRQLLLLALMIYLLFKIIINYFIFLDERVISVEGGASLKLIYFPLLYAFLLDKLEKGKMTRDQLQRCLQVYGWLILASLVIGHVTGLGEVIRGRGAEMEGGKGFMIGANEVGLMLLLTAPFVGTNMMVRTRSVLFGGIAQFLVYGWAGIHVFTKSSLIAALASAYSVYLALVRRGRNTKTFLWIGLLGVCIFVVKLIYENIDVIETFVMGSFFSVLFNEGIVAFVFRGRQDYISAILPQLIDHPLNWLFLLFGAGEFNMREMSVIPLMLPPGKGGSNFEMDFFDLFGAYGLIGFILYFCVVGLLLRQPGLHKMPIDITVVIFCVLGHAFLAGHVLFSPQVTGLLSMVLLYYHAPVVGRKLTDHTLNP